MIYIPNWFSKKRQGYQHFKNWLLNIDQNTKTVYLVACDEDTWPHPLLRRLPMLISKPLDFSHFNLVVIINVYFDIKSLKSKVGKFKSISVINWRAYWLDIGLSEIIKAQGNNRDPLNLDNFQFNKLYTLFNNEPREHRLRLLDLLYKHNLFNDGYISVNKLDKKTKKSFQHWPKPKIRKLDGQFYDDSKDINITRMLFPHQWYQAPIHIVTETNVSHVFVTEKLAQAILGGKLFLVLGGKDYHKHLKDLGFRMYDNIFDYSFDNHNTTESRIQGIINNLLNVKNKSAKQLYIDCNEAIVWNYYNCISLVKKERQKIMPEVLEKIIAEKEMISNYNELKLYDRTL